MATVTKKSKKIEIANVGAVKQLSLDVPEEGGIVVLRGRNGQGKSTAIEAVQSALSGSGSLELNDNALSGSVDAFGVTLTIGKSTRRKGELEVHSIEGKLSLGDLIDPMLKTPEAADAKRIKALVQLSGVEATTELFNDLLGPDLLRKLCRSETLKQSDPVTMAEAIKRDLEAEARREEDAAQKAEGVALGAQKAIGEIDITQECDPVKLQADLEAKLSAEMQLEARHKAHIAAVESVETAKRELEAQQAAYTGPSLADCSNAVEYAKSACQKDQEAVANAERALVQARNDFEASRVKLANAIDQQKAAERHEKTIASAKAALQATIPEAPCAEELDAAKTATQSARIAMERGALIRAALKQIADRDLALAEAKQHARQGKLLRDAGKATDDVLSGIVQKLGTTLRVNNGRLVLDTHRGETYYHDLSDGERARIAVDIAIAVVGKTGDGVLTLDQHIYEGLDPINRKELAELCRANKVLMLTAEVSDNAEIVAEVV